jgi:hypothetical protein
MAILYVLLKEIPSPAWYSARDGRSFLLVHQRLTGILPKGRR